MFLSMHTKVLSINRDYLILYMTHLSVLIFMKKNMYSARSLYTVHNTHYTITARLKLKL